MAEDLLVNIEIDSKDAKKSIENFVTELEQTDRQAIELNKALKELNKVFNQVAKESKMLAKTTKVLGNESTKALDDMAKSTSQLNKDFSEISKTSKNAAQSLDMISRVANNFKGILDGLGIITSSVLGIITSFTSTIRNLVSVFELLSNEEKIRKLAVLARILGLFAYSKGLKGTADVLFQISDRLESFGDIIVKFRENLPTFDELAVRTQLAADAIGLLGPASKATKVALALMIGKGIVGGLKEVVDYFAKFRNELGGSTRILINTIGLFRNMIASFTSFLIGGDVFSIANLFNFDTDIIGKALITTQRMFTQGFDNLMSVTKIFSMSIEDILTKLARTFSSTFSFISDNIGGFVSSMATLGNNVGMSLNKGLSDFARSIPRVFSQVIDNFRGFELVLSALPQMSVKFFNNSVNVVKNQISFISRELRGYELVLANSKNIISNFLTSFTKAAAVGSVDLFRNSLGALIVTSRNTVSAISELSSEIIHLTGLFVKGFGKGFLDPLRGLGTLLTGITSKLNLSFGVGILTLVEAATLLSPAIEKLGRKMEESENVVFSLTGSFLKLAGIISGKFVAAVSFGLSAIGAFIQKVGQNLVDSTTKAEESFRKFEVVINRFSFAIEGVGRVAGETATGGMQQWLNVLEQLNDSSTFAREEIAKSIKLLVLEGSQLGINFETNVKILKAAGDIAAATGDDLVNVVGKVISAFNGEATALANLGFNLTKTGLSHSKLTKEMGLTLEQMNEQEILQLRINELLKQTAVVQGAAANELDTITGAQIALNKTWNDTLVTLGNQAVATRTYLLLKLKLLKVFNDLPKPLIEFIGLMKDIAGVTLVVIGGIVKWTFGIIGLIGIFKVLNIALVKFLGIQISITATLGFLLKRILPIVLILVTLKKAFDRLLASSEGFRQFIEDIIDSFVALDDSAKDTMGLIQKFSIILEKILKPVLDLISLSLVGMAVLVTQLGLSYLELRRSMNAFMMTREEIKATDLMIEHMNKRLGKLNKTAINLGNDLADTFGIGNTALAEGLNKSIPKAQDKINSFREDVEKLADILMKDFDISRERIKILGDEFERQRVRIAEAAQALNKVFALGKDREKTAEELAKARQALILEGINLDKLRIDTLKRFSEIRQDSEIASLEAAGKTIQAIKLENKLRLASFDKQITGLKSLGGLTKQQLIDIDKTRKALVKLGESRIAEALAKQEDEITSKRKRELEAQQKLYEDLALTLSRINEDNIRYSQDALRIAKFELDTRFTELDLLEQRLTAAKLLTDENKKTLDIARQIAKQKFQEAKPFTVGDLVDTLKTAFKKSKDFTKDLFSEDTFKNLQTAFSEFNFKDFGNGISNALQSIDLKAMGGKIAMIVEAGLGAIKSILGGEFINVISQFGQMILDFPRMLANALGNFTRIFDNLINNIDTIMASLVENFAKILDTLIEKLPAIIGEVLPKFVQGVAKVLVMLAEALPDIIRSLLENLPILITAILEAIPVVIDAFIKAIPGVVEAITDNLPAIILAVVEGLIAALGQIVASAIDFFISGGFERVIVAIAKAIPKIVAALAMGIIKGLGRALSSIGKSLFGGGVDFGDEIEKIGESFNKGVANLQQKATEESSKLFKVLDLQAQARGVDTADRISAAINQATTNLGDTWQMLMDYLTRTVEKAWRWVVTNILEPLVGVVQKSFQWVIDNILIPILSVVQKAFQWVIDNILNPLVNVVQKAFQWVIDNILNPLANIVQKAFKWVIDNVLNKIAGFVANAFNKLGDVGKKIWEGYKNAMGASGNFFKKAGQKIWEGLKAGFNVIGNLFSKIFNTSGAWGKGKVEKVIGVDIPFLKFSQGGKVPGQATAPGDDHRNDKVVAMLSPGEYVIPRSVMADPRAQMLIDNLMSGRLQGFALGGTLGKLVKGNVIGAARDVIGAASAGAKQVADFASYLDPRELWKMIKTQVMDNLLMRILENNKFHSGGLVSGFAFGGEVPATLQNGEFVIKRAAVNKLGTGMLNRMNQGQMPSPNYNIEINMSITNKDNMNESFVRQRLIPTVKKELKDASLRGEFLISNRGIREA